MDNMIHRLGDILRNRGDAAKLAKAWGKPASMVSELISGKARLNEDAAREIAAALKIPVWHLFINPDEIYPKEDRYIVEAYKRLSGAKKLAVDEFMGLSPEEDGDHLPKKQHKKAR